MKFTLPLIGLGIGGVSTIGGITYFNLSKQSALEKAFQDIRKDVIDFANKYGDDNSSDNKKTKEGVVSDWVNVWLNLNIKNVLQPNLSIKVEGEENTETKKTRLKGLSSNDYEKIYKNIEKFTKLVKESEKYISGDLPFSDQIQNIEEEFKTEN